MKLRTRAARKAVVPRQALILLTLGALALSACGIRVSDAEVVAAEGVAVVRGPGADLPGSSGSSTGGTGPGSGVSTGGTSTTGSGAPVATGTGAGSTGGTGQSTPAGGTSTTTGNGGSGTSGTTTGTASTAACTKSGAPLVLGQVGTFTGIVGQNVGKAIPALQAWARAMNEAGGIACHPVTVISQDDGGDNGRAQSAVTDLVRNRKAQAFVGNMVPLSAAGFRRGLNSFKVPAVGGDMAVADWWQDPLMYPVGSWVMASAYGQTASLAAEGKTKVAVLYCIEASYCPPFKDAVVKYAANGGYEVVYEAQITLTAPDYTSQCQNAKAMGATQFSVITDGATISRLARSCEGVGFKAPIAAASLGATFDPNSPQVRERTVTIAANAAFWGGTETPGQRAFQEGMKRFAPNLVLNQTTILAWANGMMIKKAIESLGSEARDRPVTTAMILKGLKNIKGEKLDGLVAPQTYATSGPHPKDMCYFPARFGNNGKWSALPAGCLK